MAFGDLLGTLTGNGASVTNPSDATGSVTVAVGDLIFVCFSEQTSISAGTVTDNLGNTYTATNVGTDAGTVTGKAYYSRVTTGGTLTVVHVAASASTHNWSCSVACFAGPFTAPPIDANPANASNDTTDPYTCPLTGTLTQTSELIVGWMAGNDSNDGSASSPGTQRIVSTDAANAATTRIQSWVVSATTSVAPAFTGQTTAPTVDVLGTNSFKQSSVTSDNEQIVFISSEDDFEPEVGLELFDPFGAFAPAVTSNNEQIVFVSSEDDFEPEVGLELFDPFGAFAPAAPANNEQIVFLPSEDDFEPEVGLDQYDPSGDVFESPTFGEISQVIDFYLVNDPVLEGWVDLRLEDVVAVTTVEAISVVEAIELDPDEPGLDLVQDGTPNAVFADQAEIVAVPSEDDFEPEVGLDAIDAGAIQPVFADQSEVVSVASEDDFEAETGLDFIEQKFIDAAVAADVSEQIAVIEAFELDPDEPGLDLVSDEALGPVFADQVEIVSVAAEDDFEPEAGLDAIDAGAIQPVFADQAEIVSVASEDDFEPEIGIDFVNSEAIGPVYADGTEIVAVDAIELDPDDPGLDFVADGTPDAVYADLAEIIAVPAEDDFEPEFGLEYFEQKIVDFTAQPDVSEQIVAIDAVELDPDEYDVGHFLDESIRPVFADQAEIVSVDSIELDPDDPGLDFVADEAVSPVFASLAEIVSVPSEDDFEPEFGLEYLEQKIVDFTAQPDVSEQVVAINAIELDPDEYDVGHFLDEAIRPVFADQAEIVAVDAIELDPDDPGLDLVNSEAIGPVYADGAEIINLASEEIEAESEEERDLYRLVQALIFETDQPIIIGQLDQPEDEEDVRELGSFDTYTFENPIPFDVSFLPGPLDLGEEEEDPFIFGLPFVDPVPDSFIPSRRGVRSRFNRYAATTERSNVSNESRDNTSRESRSNVSDESRDNTSSAKRGRSLLSRRFNTWRSDS